MDTIATRLTHHLDNPMHAILPILIIVVILAVAALVFLVIVIAGIHADERHMSLTREPNALSKTIARRVLGSHTHQDQESHRPHAQTRR
jgi:uncharacterized membrane protein